MVAESGAIAGEKLKGMCQGLKVRHRGAELTSIELASQIDYEDDDDDDEVEVDGTWMRMLLRVGLAKLSKSAQLSSTLPHR
jgi:hypothetical protein